MPGLAGDTTPNPPVDSQTLLRVPVGAVSPLWGLFAGAALSGVTWWMMTRWARPENLEALFGARLPTPLAPTAPTAEPEPEPVLAQPELTVEPVVEPEPVVAAPPPALAAAPAPEAPEPAPEPVVETASEPAIVEALVEPELPAEPVGGEAGPISPILASIPEPEPMIEAKAEAPAEPAPAPKANPAPMEKAAAAAPREPRSVSPKPRPAPASKPV